MAIPDSGYVVYDPSFPSVEYAFDVAIGGRGTDDVITTHNENRVELRTFGSVPYVYYAGETDYVSFDLSTVFYYDDENKESARSQMDRFKRMVRKRKILMVENSQGQIFKCDIFIAEERAPSLYVEEDLDYIEVKIRCTQIAL